MGRYCTCHFLCDLAEEGQNNLPANQLNLYHTSLVRKIKIVILIIGFKVTVDCVCLFFCLFLFFFCFKNRLLFDIKVSFI